MANDNTMGAPTKGFGQNVTFTFDSAPGAPSLQGGDASGVGNFGVRGGAPVDPNGSQGHAVQGGPESGTFRFLSSIADNQLAEKFKQQQTAAYVGGMQQAMQGVAVKDVIDQQPWWSKLFGVADSVEGARAYTGNATAQLAAAQMIDDMPNMREMDGPTAQSFYVQKVNSLMTGDPATDLSIQQGLMRSLPNVMRQQAKEHYAWTQQQATAAEDASFKASAANLQGQGANLVGDMVSPEELQQAQRDWAGQQVPAAGRDLNNWRDAMMDRLIGAARQGQFHVINAAQLPIDGKDGPSLLSTLKADQQAQVLVAIERGQSEALKQNFPQYADAVSDIKIRSEKPGNFPGTGDEGHVSPEDVANSAELLNRQYMQRTGSSIGLFSGEQIANMRAGTGVNVINILESQAKARQAAADKAQTAAQKELATRQKNQLIVSSFSGGTDIDGSPIQGGQLAYLAATPGYSKEAIDYAATIAYRSMTPEQQQAALIANRGYEIKPIQIANDNGVEAAIASSPKEMGNAVMQQVGKFQALYKADPETAIRYYPRYADKMVYFSKLVDEGVSPESAFAPAFVNPIKQQPVSDAEKKSVIAGLTDKYSSWIGPNMPPETINFLANHIETNAARWNGVTGDPKQATQIAMKQLESSGKVEVLGGYAWDADKDASKRVIPWLTKQYGADKVAANKANIALPYDTVDETFRHAVSAYVNGAAMTDQAGHTTNIAGIAYDEKPTHTILTPIQSLADGVPRWTVQAMLKDGTIVRGIMNANDVQKYAKQAKDSSDNEMARSVQRHAYDR